MAISMIKQNGFKANGNPTYSFQEAVQTFHVSKTTLTACFNGWKTCEEGHKHEWRVNDAPEAVLVEWIQECGHQNMAYLDHSAQGGRLWCRRHMPIMFQSEKETSSTTIQKHRKRCLQLTLSKMHGVRLAFGH